MYKSPRISTKKISAQAMVEFALALPILLLVVYGLLETGRLIFMYASVVTAARQAARYGAASGDIGNGTLYYNDCAGIQAAANKVAFIQRFSAINIAYDTGPSTAVTNGCPYPSAITDNEHRIDVTVSSVFNPIVPLLPFRTFTITSTSNRTILTGVSIAVDAAAAQLPPGGSGTIRLVKRASPTSYTQAGQTINYTLTVTNLGSDPVTSIVVTDPMLPNNNTNDIHCPDGNPFNLGTSGTETCTAVYTTTQADLDGTSGHVDANRNIVNTATAAGIDSTNTPVTSQSTATVNFVGTPKLELAKSGTAPGTIAAGQNIAYTFTLTNTGNVPLTSPYAISDPIVSNANCSGVPSPLAVGASGTCTGTYALKNTDINRGYVDNTAHATARYGSATVTSNNASAHVLTPELYLALTADKSTVSAAGDVITFTYTVRNNTSSGMSNIKVSDTLGASGMSCVTSLGAGATNSCTRTYTITQADLDGSSALINTATASAQGNINSNQSGVTITIAKNPLLTLAKTAAPPSTIAVGANITYTYVLTNAGNVTLSAPFGITDNKIPTLTCAGFTTGTLAPKGTKTCTATYPLTQADLDNGTVVNQATATAVLASQQVTSAVASAMVITYPGARLTVVKTSDVQAYLDAGTTINYIYTLQNTGGVPLIFTGPYTLTDDKLGAIVCGAIGTIPVGGSAICATVPHLTTADDVKAGHITNTVTATTTGISTNPPGPIALVQADPLTIFLYVCNSGTVTSGGPVPDAAQKGPNLWTSTWWINNLSGLPIHISSVVISWNTTAPLIGIQLNGIPVWTGSKPSIATVTGGPAWTLKNAAANPMLLSFSGAATGIKVSISFVEPSCNFVVSSGP